MLLHTRSPFLRGVGLLLAALVGSVSLLAQTFSPLHLFHGNDGSTPRGSVIIGSDGLLYGATTIGGNYSNGTLFRLNKEGSGFVTLKHFQDSTTGIQPNGTVLEGADGLLYGTTLTGSPNYGTVYRIAPDGTGFTVLHNFTTLASGGNSYAPLIQGSDGMLYGTTRNGGANSAGTVFRLNTDGSGFAVVHHFVAATDGSFPQAGLLQGADGALYGAASGGGQFANGTVFRMNLDGSGFTVLHHFQKAISEGDGPMATLIQAADGLLYGTTFHGGQFNRGTAFRLATNGSGFTTIHHFRGGTTDGYEPVTGALVQHLDGMLYGTTQQGGLRNWGIIYRMSPDGSNFSILLDFLGDNGKFGATPLALDDNGDLYAAAVSGGEQTSGILNSGLVFCFGAPKVPKITVGGTIATNYGSAFSYQISATGNPTSYGATGLPPGVSVNATTGLLSGTIGATGNFDILLSATNANGTGTEVLHVNVSPAQATVTLGELNFVYDGAAKPVAAATSPAGLSVGVTYNGAATPPTDAGSYAVVATITDPNYSGSSTGALVISPATATVTLDDLNRTYDGSPKAATATTAPAGLNVVLTYDGGANAPVNAGSYSVTGTISDPNYTGSGSGTLVIAKAAASITLGSLNPVYDGSPKPVAVTTTPAALPVAVTYNGSPDVPVNAGSYAVEAVITDSNYTGTASGTLVVAKAAASVSLGGLNVTYDGAPKAVTTSTAPGGLAVNVTYDGGSTPPTGAGSYAVTAVVNDANYTGGASGTLNIAKASASIALGNLAQTYDGSAKLVTTTVTPGGLAVAVTYDGGPNAPVNAGSYAVSAVITDANYAGAASGTLTIGQAAASLVLGNLNPTYNGSPKPVSVTTIPAGLAVAVTYDGSATAPTNAGTYAVACTVLDGNYSGSTSGTLVIAKAAASIALGNLSQTYDGSARVASASTTPAGLGVTVTYDGSATPPVNAGTYAVAASITNPNYTGSASGSLTVAKAAASITLGNLSQTYNGSARVASASTTPAGLGVAITYNGSATAPVNAGTYAVAATITDANYTGSASGSLTVAKAVATVTLANLAQAYNGTPRPVSVTTAPAGLAVNVTYNGSGTAPTNPGSYPVVATVNDVNYTGTASGTLQISVILQASGLAATGSGPSISTNSDAAAPGGTWVGFASTKQNQWVQFTTGNVPAGTYQLQFVYRAAPTRGKHTVKLDGATVGGTIDQYASGVSYQTVNLGTVVFATSGTHTVRLTTSAKNSASSGWDLSAVRFVLNP